MKISAHHFFVFSFFFVPCRASDVARCFFDNTKKSKMNREANKKSIVGLHSPVRNCLIVRVVPHKQRFSSATPLLTSFEAEKALRMVDWTQAKSVKRTRERAAIDYNHKALLGRTIIGGNHVRNEMERGSEEGYKRGPLCRPTNTSQSC